MENSNDFGTFAQLSAILVEKLVEYNSPNSGAGSEFGDIVQDEAKPASNVAEQAPKATPAKKVAPKKEEPAGDDFDESDAPF